MERGRLDLFWLIFFGCGGTSFGDGEAIKRMRPLSAQRQFENRRMLDKLGSYPIGGSRRNPTLILL